MLDTRTALDELTIAGDAVGESEMVDVDGASKI
jgi:hypothetical protein